MTNWTEHKWKLTEKDGDMYAGDVKLTTNTEWNREYMDEWAGPPSGPFAAVYYGRRGGKTQAMAEAADRAVAEGKSVAISTPVGPITIKSDPTLKPGEFWVDGKAPRCDREEDISTRCLRRIPRSAEVKQPPLVSPEIYAERDRLLGQFPDPELADAVRAVEETTGEQYGKNLRGLFDAMRREFGTVSEVKVLYDGIDSDSCLYRWWDNRSCLESGTPILYEMTPAQIAEAKACHARVYAHDREALRAKVKESAERERNVVRVEIQDWED